jgi:4-amino-4-deoxy-L-arabinose transferase-like glycosyltransferase
MGVRLGPGWQSPAAIPRRWLAGLFAVSAIFASLVAIFSSDQVHQLWGAMAACGYGLAVAAVLGWRKRGVDLALGLSFCGALVLPLGWMAAKALEQPEVAVVARSAWTLIHQGSPYAGAASLATTHNPNAYNPYLPVMTLFGLPRAVIGGGALTDPRVWFGLVFILVFWLALRDGGARHPGRWAILIAASPVIAFELAVGGTDVPMVAFLCLGFALLWGAQGQACRPVLAGLALGVAAAMKATAWPALLVAAVLLTARDGRRAAGVLLATSLAVFVAIVGPVAVLWPRALVQNTILFPLGLASIKSQAVSPLPGHLLVETGHTGHLIAVALLALACLGIVASLAIWPPRTVPAATWRLVIGLSLMFVLAPATRFGYFLYPAGLLAWLGISWVGSNGGAEDPEAGSARAENASAHEAYQPANQGSPAASGTMYSTVWA